MPIFNLDVKARGTKKASKGVQGVSTSIKGLMASAGPMVAAFVGVQKVMQGFGASIELAGKMEKVGPAFENLAKQSGFSADAFENFNSALDGTVPKVELMEMANNAMLLGITDNEEQMAKMFDTAQRLASAVGEDAAFGVNSLVTGLGRQSKLMLDNLGIIVDTAKANEDYAKSIGKSSSELTDQEKKTAFTNAALKEADKLVNKLGKEQLTTADRMKQAKTSMENLGITIGTAMGPMVDKGVEMFGSFVNVLDEGLKTAGNVDWLGTFKNWFGNIQAGGTLVWKLFKAIWDYIPDLAKQAFEKFSTDVWPFLKEKFMVMVEGIAKIGQFIFEPMWIGAQIMWEHIKKHFAVGGAHIENAFSATINKLIDAYNYFAGSRAGRWAGMKKMTRKELIDTDDIKAGYDDTIAELQKKGQQTDMVKALTGLSEDNISTAQDFTDTLGTIFQEYADEMIVMKEETNEVLNEMDNEQMEGELEKLNEQTQAKIGLLDHFKNEQFAKIDEQYRKLKEAGVKEVDLEKWKTEQINKWQKQDLKNRLKVGSELLGALAGLNDAMKGSAKVTARLQQIQAVINTYSSATAAIAPPPVGYGPTPVGYAAAATAVLTGLANVVTISQSIGDFAKGGDFITQGEQIIRVGDNPGGRERVQITPLSSPNINGPKGGNDIVVNISGNVMSENYTEDIIIPHIQDAIRRGETL